MIVTKASDPYLYDDMLAARRDSLIQADLVVRKAEAWVAAQKAQMAVDLKEIADAKEKRNEDAAEVMARHKDLTARLKVFETALAEFKARITAANSCGNLAGFDMTRDNDYQGLPSQFASAHCPMPDGKNLYAALDEERALSRFNPHLETCFAVTLLFLVAVVSSCCAFVFSPLLYVLIPAAIIVGLVFGALNYNTHDQIQLEQPVFLKNELNALLDDGKVPAVKGSVISSSIFNKAPVGVFCHEQTKKDETLWNAAL